MKNLLLLVSFVIISIKVMNSFGEQANVIESGVKVNMLEYQNPGNTVLKKAESFLGNSKNAHAKLNESVRNSANNNSNNARVELNIRNENKTLNFTNSFKYNKNDNMIDSLKNKNSSNKGSNKIKKKNLKKQINDEEGFIETENEKLNDTENIKKNKRLPPNFIGPRPKPDNQPKHDKRYFGPELPDRGKPITCEEINKNARFNPFSILNRPLFQFYFWGTPVEENSIEFQLARSPVMQIIQDKVDAALVKNNQKTVNWTRPHVIMVDLVRNTSALLVEKNNRGLYTIYPLVEHPDFEMTSDWHIQFKQSSNGKYIVMAICQGHEWLPVEEMEDTEYWAHKYGGHGGEDEKIFEEEELAAKNFKPPKNKPKIKIFEDGYVM